MIVRFGWCRQAMGILGLGLFFFAAAAAFGSCAQERIVINLPARSLRFYQDQERLREYPVAIGKPSTPTPVGETEVISRLRYPYYQSMPPGPDNPLGVRWLGLGWPRYGIHGTNAPEAIGTAVSLGCIRMYNEDVIELFSLTPLRTTVEIVYEVAEVDASPDGTAQITLYPDMYNRHSDYRDVVQEVLTKNRLVLEENDGWLWERLAAGAEVTVMAVADHPEQPPDPKPLHALSESPQREDSYDRAIGGHIGWAPFQRRLSTAENIFETAVADESKPLEQAGRTIGGYSPERLEAELGRLAQRYPELVQLHVIEQHYGERYLYAVQFGGGEREVLMHASHAEGDSTAVHLLLNTLEAYASAYGNDQQLQGFDVRSVLDDARIWFVLTADSGLDTSDNDNLTGDEHLVHSDDAAAVVRASWAKAAREALAISHAALRDAVSVFLEQPLSDTQLASPMPLAAPAGSLEDFLSARRFEMALFYYASDTGVVHWAGQDRKVEHLVHRIAEEMALPVVDSGIHGALGMEYAEWFLERFEQPAIAIGIDALKPDGVPDQQWWDGFLQEHTAVGLLAAGAASVSMLEAASAESGATVQPLGRYIQAGHKVQGGTEQAGLTVGAVRWGRHSGYERLVFDIYESSRRVPETPVSQPPLFGLDHREHAHEAVLTLEGTRLHSLTAVPAFRSSRLIKEVRPQTSHRSETVHWAVSFTRPVEIKVFTMDSPGRIVLDVRALGGP